MTREEAITVLKTLMKNPLFSEVHKVAFNIAIHDIKQRHDWDINNLILINKDNYEPNCSEIPTDSTTKENLGVDAVSRQALIDWLKNWTLGDASPLIDFVNSMPPVTPQEPKTGHWTEEFNDLEGEVRFTCSSCGKYQLFGTDFCYHCGSDNREVEE